MAQVSGCVLSQAGPPATGTFTSLFGEAVLGPCFSTGRREGTPGEHPHPRPVSRAQERGVGIGTVRYPRIVPKDEECAKELKKRTLTSLYNQRPTWLDLAHRRLDEAVFAAYGWDPEMSDEQLLATLLDLNLQRAGA